MQMVRQICYPWQFAEVKEEAGISNVLPVSEDIFSLESLTVDGHWKNGK